MITIYHNPRCGKSRDCLTFLAQTQKEVNIIKYLENPISKQELIDLLHKLKIKPIELIRTKEKIWIENFKGKVLDEAQIIDAILTYPILMERPIVVKDHQAIVARTLEKLNQIL